MQKKVKLIAILLVIVLIVGGCANASNATSATSSGNPSVSEQAENSPKATESETPQEIDDYVVKIMDSSGLCAAPQQVAMHMGYFEEEGLQFESIRTSGTQNTYPELVASGQVDAMMMMLPLISLQLNNGVDFRIVGGVHKGCLSVITSADSDIESIGDLKGKVIGVPGIGSSPMILAQRALLKEGIAATMEAGEVEFLSFNGGDLPIAMENGSVDAIACNEPTASLLVAQGSAKLVFDQATHDYFKDEICCVMVMNVDFAENHPGLAAKFVRAMQKACDYVSENPAEMAQYQIDNELVANKDLEINAALLEAYDYRGEITGGKAAFRTNLEELQQLGLLNAEFDIDAIVEKYYLELDGVEDV